MAVLLSFVCVGCSSFLPEQIIEPAEIANLVRDLDSDEFWLRDRATKRLRAIGTPALDFFERAGRAQRSVDFIERADRLMREIRLESCRGGEIMRGVQLTLRADRFIFRTDEDVVMHLKIRNVSCAPRFDCAPLRWGYTQSHGPSAFVVRSSAPYNGLLQLHQLSGRRAKVDRSAGGWNILFNPNEDRPIAIGNKVVELIEIGNRIGRLTPGEYDARFTFSWHTRDGFDLKRPHFGLQSHELVSNTVRFSVENR
jgi:hypothetical protein